MCKRRRITQKFNIWHFVLYSVCEYFGGVYISIKSTTIKSVLILLVWMEFGYTAAQEKFQVVMSHRL